ncbi:MAG: hypothetical protein U5P41_15140 [Gammaproteobacteria bacterium]|nr:hypothetical protein [Gammaproteobacteria bacterium]
MNENVLIGSGLGALQFRQAYGDETDETGSTPAGAILQPEEVVDWVEQARSLENRTLIIWLSVLAIMTIAGWTS